MTFDFSDVLIMLGALAIVTGAGYIYLPAGAIVLGLELVAAGLLLTHQPNSRR